MRGVSIVIPNYNGVALLRKYLPSLQALCAHYAGDTEIIVADDASTDDSRQMLSADFPDVRVIARERNGGFSANCNSGLAVVRHGLVFFCNSDVAVEPDFLDHIAPHFDDPAVFAVTPCGKRMHDHSPLDGAVFLRWSRGSLRHSHMKWERELQAAGQTPPYRCDRVQGAYFVADTAKMRQLGGFDELYSPYYWEETDLSYRARKRAWQIHWEPRAIAYHECGTTIARQTEPLRRKAIRKRNRIFFHLTCLDSRWRRWVFLASTILNLCACRPSIWWAGSAALGRWPALRRRRHHLQTVSVLGDRDLL